MTMARPRREKTRNRSVRLPARLWDLLDEASKGQGKTSNNLLWRMVEDYLAKRGLIGDRDRKRPPIDQGNDA